MAEPAAKSAAFSRLLSIHPFVDGNGRVARLMPYVMYGETLDTGGLWSFPRALARRETAYKQHLTACDMQRRNDPNGRGTLSEEALAEFAIFFLQTCIDQVAIMQGLAQPDQLRNRILIWAEEETRADRSRRISSRTTRSSGIGFAPRSASP